MKTEIKTLKNINPKTLFGLDFLVPGPLRKKKLCSNYSLIYLVIFPRMPRRQMTVINTPNNKKIINKINVCFPRYLCFYKWSLTNSSNENNVPRERRDRKADCSTKLRIARQKKALHICHLANLYVQVVYEKERFAHQSIVF